MKKLQLLLLFTTLVFSIYGCKDTNSNPAISPEEEIYWSKIENIFPNHSWVMEQYKNNIDGKQYLNLLRKDTNIVDIYVSDDGVDWELRESIIPENLDFDFGFEVEYTNDYKNIYIGKHNVIFYKIRNRLFRSLSKFENFEEIYSNLKDNGSIVENNFYGEIMFDEDGTIYSGMSLKSTDNGDTWQKLGGDIEYASNENTLFNDQTIVVFHYDYYYISQNQGESWTLMRYPDKHVKEGYLIYNNPEDLLYQNPNPIDVKKHNQGTTKLYYMTKDSTMIANICGNNTVGKNKWEYSLTFNLYTSSDFGEDWEFQFCVENAWKVNYIEESGYFYITSPLGILRNKKPVK